MEKVEKRREQLGNKKRRRSGNKRREAGEENVRNRTSPVRSDKMDREAVIVIGFSVLNDERNNETATLLSAVHARLNAAFCYVDCNLIWRNFGGVK